MRKNRYSLFLVLILTITYSACFAQKKALKEPEYKYVPDNQELYNTIVAMDSTFFYAYNTCDLNKQAAIYSDNNRYKSRHCLRRQPHNSRLAPTPPEAANTLPPCSSHWCSSVLTSSVQRFGNFHCLFQPSAHRRIPRHWFHKSCYPSS